MERSDIRDSRGRTTAPHFAALNAGYGGVPNSRFTMSNLARAFAHPTRVAEFTFTMSNSPARSRDALRPGFEPFLHPPDEGWRSAETALGCSGTRDVP